MTASGGMHTLDIAYLHHVDSFRMSLFDPRSSRIFKKNPSTKIPQLGRSILLVNRQSIMVKNPISRALYWPLLPSFQKNWL
jgi:hypothetical protein